MQSSTVNGTELGAQECRDALFLQYGLEPPDLLTYSDGCNAKFTICHTINCKRGGLVMARHNKLWDWVAYLAGNSFTPSHMQNDPLIFTGRAVKRTKSKPAGASGTTDRDGGPPPEVTEQKGYLLIRDL